MTTDIRDGRRTVAGGLLFAGVALAAFLGSGATAYAQETTTTTAPPATTASTTAAGDTSSTGSAPADSSTAAAPQDSSSGTLTPTDTSSASTGSGSTTTSTPTYGPAKTARMEMEAKAAARKANRPPGTAGASSDDDDDPADEAGAAAIGTGDGGENGGVVPLIQTVTIGADGTAWANTGNNVVTGNSVLVYGPVNQKVRLFGLFRGPIVVTTVNQQTVTNNLIGHANATTGDANSTGATTSTGVTQTIGSGGSSGGGSAATGQSAAVTNTGNATSNTGGNTVIGNDVTVNAPAVQVVRTRGPPGQIGTITLINNQDVRTDAEGHAKAETGDAEATGLVANTSLGQSQGGSGVGTGAQSATVNNTGNASANTGGNTVIGNNLVVNIPVNQVVRLFGIFRGAITITMVNRQEVVNTLNGSASLVTGDASATGLVATTSVAQSGSGAGSGGGSQSATVNNTGNATANTGNNTVIGNNVIINMPVTQKVPFFGIFRGPITVVLVNNQTIVNNLTGSASLVTGDATATGLIATTTIRQAMGPERDSDGIDGTVKRVKRQGHGGAAARARSRGARHGRTSGELPVTGGSLAVQALAGLLLIALGATARRSARTA